MLHQQYMDVGIIDVNTCEPVEGVLVDLCTCHKSKKCPAEESAGLISLSLSRL